MLSITSPSKVDDTNCGPWTGLGGDPEQKTILYPYYNTHTAEDHLCYSATLTTHLYLQYTVANSYSGTFGKGPKDTCFNPMLILVY